ncbi:MAG: hypothetical protein ACRD1V_08680, partial [Vicinamibacterales bacterium]
MRFRLSLQWRVLLLLTGGMGLIVVLSGYLHGLIASSDIEEDRYSAAIGRTVALAGRIVALQASDSPDQLHKDLGLVVDTRKDFVQIDVYQPTSTGDRRAATTANATADPLPILDEHTPDNDLGEMERPSPGVVTMEVLHNRVRYWLISVAMKQRTG